MQPSKLQLPDGWVQSEAVTDAPIIDGVRIRRAGMAATSPRGEEAVGAAASTTDDPAERAAFELMERIAVLEAMFAAQSKRDSIFPESDEPARWRFARSNGVAFHTTWDDACQRAYWESVERHRVLASWYAQRAPRRRCVDLGLTSSYAWPSYSFSPAVGDLYGTELAVVAVFGFPPDASMHTVVGYAARPDAQDAEDAAAREALQSLAFMWDEPPSKDLPAPGPTAMHHLERVTSPAFRNTLQAWLGGGGPTCPPLRFGDGVVPSPTFVDLTPPWLTAGRIAKALAPAAVPMTFGDVPFASSLPAAIRVHPIP